MVTGGYHSLSLSFMDATEDAAINVTENTGRRKRKNTHNNCTSKKTKKQATPSQLKLVEETIAEVLSQQDTANTFDLYSNFSSDEEVGDEGDLQVRLSNNITNEPSEPGEPSLKPQSNTNLHDEVAILRKENFYLKTVVESVNRRVNFILSFLEISNNEENINVSASSPGAFQRTDTILHHDSSANVLHQTTKTTLQQSVLSTFHNVLHQKERRKRNVIVKGLQPSLHTDKDLFRNLCLKEFNFQLDIVRCKRLGKQQDGRIQPLLVTISSVNQAEMLIQSAKQLRNSRCRETKNFGYINPDLTKEEAKVAYDRRYHKRAQLLTTHQPRVQVRKRNNSQLLLSRNTQHTPDAITDGRGMHGTDVQRDIRRDVRRREGDHYNGAATEVQTSTKLLRRS